MTQIRLAPSGPPITNPGGGPLSFGPGARLRLTEATSTMGGSLAIPTASSPSDTTSLISPLGFGNPAAIVLTLAAPKQALSYRANLLLDVINTSTNLGGEVVLFLDVSVDGGVTYNNQARNSHYIHPEVNANNAQSAGSRSMQVFMPLILGQSIGVNDATPTPSIKLRARAQSVVFPPGTSLLVQSDATSDGSAPPAPVPFLNGTIHMELEECF